MLLTAYLGIVLLTYLNNSISNSTSLIIYILVLNVLIYATDFFDGKLARKWHVCSKLGESLDVFSDLGYMTSQYYLLIRAEYMSWAILACIYLEFLVFIITSLYYKPVTRKTFLFNKIGKIVAVYYYLLPLLYIGAIYLKCNIWVFLSMNALCLVLTVLAILDRLAICLNFYKLQDH